MRGLFVAAVALMTCIGLWMTATTAADGSPSAGELRELDGGALKYSCQDNSAQVCKDAAGDPCPAAAPCTFLWEGEDDPPAGTPGTCRRVQDHGSQGCSTADPKLYENCHNSSWGWCRTIYENPCTPENEICDEILMPCGPASKCHGT